MSRCYSPAMKILDHPVAKIIGAIGTVITLFLLGYSIFLSIKERSVMKGEWGPTADGYIALSALMAAGALIFLTLTFHKVLNRKFRTKGRRFGELKDEFDTVAKLAPTPELEEMFDAGIADPNWTTNLQLNARIENLQTELAKLDVPCPYPNRHGDWFIFATTMSVLAEQRRYKDAKAYWSRRPSG